MEGYEFMKIVIPILGLQRLRETVDNTIISKTSISDNLLDIEEENVIDFNKVDFSQTTVVLGKTGNVSSQIVDIASKKLQDIGVNTYVSDIDHLILGVSEQATLENPLSSVLVIKIDAGAPRGMVPTVVVGCETERYDSLGLAVSTSIDVERVNVEKGKIISGINIPTELENELCKKDYNNRIFAVTVIPEKEVDSEMFADNIVDAVARFTVFRDFEKERKYYAFARDECRWKAFEDSKSGVSTNVAIYPVVCYANIIKTNQKTL